MHRDEDFLEQTRHAPECLLAVEDVPVAVPAENQTVATLSEASEHTTQMAASRNEDMASELAMSSSTNQVLSTNGMASELTASSSSQAAANVSSSASSEIVAPPELPSETSKSWWGESGFNEFTAWCGKVYFVPLVNVNMASIQV